MRLTSVSRTRLLHDDGHTKAKTVRTIYTANGREYDDREESYGVPMMADPNDPYGTVPDFDSDGYAYTSTYSDGYGTQLADPMSHTDFNQHAHRYPGATLPGVTQNQYLSTVQSVLLNEFSIPPSSWEATTPPSQNCMLAINKLQVRNQNRGSTLNRRTPDPA